MRSNRTNRHTQLTKKDLSIISLSMKIQKNGYLILQYSFALVFIWFGILKLTGSAQVDLLMTLFSSFLPVKMMMFFFGLFEVIIGLSMLKSNWIIFSLKLLVVYMPITLLPFIFSSEQCFIDFPLILSLEGKSIISHLALISSSIIIAGRQHTKIIELKV